MHKTNSSVIENKIKAEIDRRLEKYLSGKTTFHSWEKIKIDLQYLVSKSKLKNRML